VTQRKMQLELLLRLFNYLCAEVVSKSQANQKIGLGPCFILGYAL